MERCPNCNEKVKNLETLLERFADAADDYLDALPAERWAMDMRKCPDEHNALTMAIFQARKATRALSRPVKDGM